VIVTVRAPATIANLGPGFDCLGLAIAWHNTITLSPAETTTIEVTGGGAERIPRDDRNLALRAVRAWEKATGREPGEFEITIDNESPYGRGFGSSAAAIVGGLVAAKELLGGDASILKLAGELEGHLDNVSACLLGGVTVSGYAPDDALRIDPPSGIAVLACVAPGRLSTSEARAALPARVALKDASFNSARTALLAASLASGDPARLMQATEDRLHQNRRFQMAPHTGAMVRALREKGIAAFLSGAGPSVAALVAADRAEKDSRTAKAVAGEGWDVRVVEIDAAGAVVTSG
jgi:homoserine kinase